MSRIECNPTKRLVNLREHFKLMQRNAESRSETSRACALSEVVMLLNAEICAFEALFGAAPEPVKEQPILNAIEPEELPSFVHDLIENAVDVKSGLALSGQGTAKLARRFNDIGHTRLKAVK